MNGLGTFTWGTGENYYGWWKDGVMDGESHSMHTAGSLLLASCNGDSGALFCKLIQL